MADYSFTMTAGDFGGFIQGYSPDFSIGSIDAEPVPGHALRGLFENGSVGLVEFQGDAVSLLAGKTLWVDGVEFPLTAQDWTYDSGGDVTNAIADSPPPTFVNTVSYFIEIKDPGGGGPTYGDGALGSAGAGSLTAVGRSTAAAVLTAAGTGTTSFLPEAAGTLSAAGTGALSGVGAAVAAASLSVAGSSHMAGTGAAVAVAAAASAGQGIASFVPQYFSTPFLPAGQGRGVTRSGGSTWSNPNNIRTDDGNDALTVITPPLATSSNWLAADTLGLSAYLPSNLDAIVGIEVKVQASKGIGDGDLTQVNVGKSDSTLATAKGPQALTTSAVNYTFGGVGDLWGLSWSRSDLIASTFQARLYSSATTTSSVNVDIVSVRVHYQLTQGTADAVLSSSGTGAASFAGAVSAAAALTSSGVATLVAAGGTVTPAALTASGIGDLSATGAATADALLTADGAGTFTAVSQAGAVGVLTAAGSATVALSGASIARASLSAAGAAGFSPKGTALATSTLGSQGTASATFYMRVAWEAAGASTVSFTGVAVSGSIFSSQGVAGFAATGASIADGIMLAAGAGLLTAEGGAQVIVSGSMHSESASGFAGAGDWDDVRGGPHWEIINDSASLGFADVPSYDDLLSDAAAITFATPQSFGDLIDTPASHGDHLFRPGV